MDNIEKTKRILFLTGTRADFGKMKTLMLDVESNPSFESHIFITGMHTLNLYGNTSNEVKRAGFENTYTFVNQIVGEPMEVILATTISGLSRYVHELQPDMIVIHGDRVEALAGAIVGSLGNILVAHIEGGELSGTIDELIRHSVSKLSHLHLVANKNAQDRLIQMGESKDCVHIIGSPDIDVMISKDLPSLKTSKEYYELPFENYGTVLFHPVTTEYKDMRVIAHNFVDALLESDQNYLVVYPNNDYGCKFILEEYRRLEADDRFRVIASLRFEYFLTLLKNSDFIIGNSSAGIREAPFYGLPSVNVGTRQNNRFLHTSIVSVNYDTASILTAINTASSMRVCEKNDYFGSGNSTELFMNIINNPKTWETSVQKQFNDISFPKPVAA